MVPFYLLSNCSYNPMISRVTIVMGLIFRIVIQLLSQVEDI